MKSIGFFLKPRLYDPRIYQIAVLTSLLVYGIFWLDLEVRSIQAVMILITVLLTQYLCTRVFKLPEYDPRSPLISGLSLCLLLRTNSLMLVGLTSFITIFSKFTLRFRGKHIFNPTNFGIVLMILLTDLAWVSPGQWGNVAFFAFLVACLGGLVVNRAYRSDVTYAFVGFYITLLLGRALWLGDSLHIPLHQIQNGAFLVFTFFMISDPKTTPDSRMGRILFAFLVAAGAFIVHFVIFRTNGLLWSLAFFSLFVPLIDWLLPGNRYEWKKMSTGIIEEAMIIQPLRHKGEECRDARFCVTTSCNGEPVARQLIQSRRFFMKTMLAFTLVLMSMAISAESAFSFCGFYVAKADTKLFNKASQVVIVRDEDKTVMTMANDFKGDRKEFAIVIPVPTFIEREQIHIPDKALIDHLDAYSAPRLVEYFDDDPCSPVIMEERAGMSQPAEAPPEFKKDSLGVTVEARYTVGEYDIVILSAEQGQGLEAWLKQSGYRIPLGASDILGSYIKQKMRFFVAKVNLKEQSKLGFSYLRPIQVAYESPKFMLPIRLGTINADGAQELFIFVLNRKGRVETTNYRTVKLPTGMDLPVYIRGEFADFYRAMFDLQVKKENMEAVFLEYAWDMNWCDPCPAEPLSQEELRNLGVFWLDGKALQDPWMGGAQDVFISRLHVRYDAKHFPEDLVFQETADRENFQGRYVLRHPWTGNEGCESAKEYKKQLPKRWEQEAQTLASLTGWDINNIRKKMNIEKEPKKDDRKWWKKIWKD